MNRLLIILGCCFLLAGVMVFVWPASEKTRRTDSSSGKTPPKSVHDDCGHEHESTASASSMVLHLADLPRLSQSLKTSAPMLDWPSAHARPLEGQILRQASGSALRLQKFPLQGQAEILNRNTLAGIDAENYLTTKWDATQDAMVTFTLPSAQTLVVAREKGIWSCRTEGVDSKISSACTDLARVINAAKTAFAEVKTCAVGASVTIAGESFVLWTAEKNDWLFVAPLDGGITPQTYPPQPGTWNDLRICSDAQGTWQSAERLTTSPATPEEPGFLVRRVILRFP